MFISRLIQHMAHNTGFLCVQWTSYLGWRLFLWSSPNSLVIAYQIKRCAATPQQCIGCIFPKMNRKSWFNVKLENFFVVVIYLQFLCLCKLVLVSLLITFFDFTQPLLISWTLNLTLFLHKTVFLFLYTFVPSFFIQCKC